MMREKFSNKYKNDRKFYKIKKSRKTCMDAKICVSNLLKFLQKLISFTTLIKNMRDFFLARIS